MKNVTHFIGAVLAGVFSAFFIIVLSQLLSGFLFPMPEELKDLDPRLIQNKALFNEFMRTASVWMFLTILVGYMLASFLGGWVASLVKKNSVPVPALIVGLLLTFAGILNLTFLEHPTWFVIINIPSFLLFAWLGSKMVNTKHTES